MSPPADVPPPTCRVAVACRVRRWWVERRVTLLRLAVAVLSVCAALKLGEGFWRLVSPRSLTGANDLKFRYAEVQQWFAGQPIYTQSPHAICPPATYPMLWPLLGWLDFTVARQLWAATSVLLLVALTYLLVKESGAATTLEGALVAVLLLSMNATGLTIGNGQLTLHLLVPLIASVLFLRRGGAGWVEDLVIALALLVALMKPNDSVPFFWLVLFLAGRLRLALLVGVGYVALTLFAAAFQPASLPTLLAQWFANASAVAESFGYANLHAWLATIGLERWNFPASLLALMALGVWTYHHRHSDLWIVLGVTGIVTRFWTYHLSYDDMWIVLPMIALFRLATRGPAAGGRDVLAGVLLAACTVVMLTPETLRHSPPPWPLLFSLTHTVVWVGMLIFLLDWARRFPRWSFGGALCARMG